MLMSAARPLAELENAAEFAARHIGPDADDEAPRCCRSSAPRRAQALIDAVVPRAIARAPPMELPRAGRPKRRRWPS